jgi:ribosome-binding ATPase YchF (GTP1/OBG family)
VSEGDELPEGLPGDAIAMSAALEAEVAGMEDDEARELLAGFGVEEPGLDRVIAACYRALDLITFLTTGEDETRAWEVRKGAKAPEAAGVIHSDLERGFIRAEVVGYDELVAIGSWDAAKAKGSLRVEGKDYLVKEGDVLNIRFAV